LQRNKKLAHKIKRSQTTKKRKGQKKTYLNPRGENKTIGLAKGRGKNPGGTGTGVGVHSIQKHLSCGEVFSIQRKKFVRVLYEWINLAWAYDDFTTL
jgi:hypothetical protein